MKDIVKNIVKEFKKILLNNEFKYISFAYSGGKDSSLIMVLFFKTLEVMSEKELDVLKNKTIFIVNSDTGIEIPDYQILVDNTLKNIKEKLNELGLTNIEVKQVSPELKNRYFSLIIGKGYTLPRRDYRWCSERLKISPNDKLFKEIFKKIKNEKLLVITGSRKDESLDRKKRLEENTLDGFLKKDINGGNKVLFTPIEDLTTAQVWKLLDFANKIYPFLNLKEIKALYIQGSKSKDEINTRFGCMYCPLVTRDYTLENIAKEKIYLKPILRFRNWLVKFTNEWSVRDYYNHRNFKISLYDFDNHRKGMVAPGGYSVEFRMEILEKLLRAEKKANKLYQVYKYGKVVDCNRKDIKLITDEELAYIQEKWIEEGDVKLRALRTAKEFNRDFTPTKETIEIKNIAEDILADREEWELWDLETTRKVCVFAKEFLKTKDAEKAFEKMREISVLEDYKMNLIKKEWEEDKISFVTFLRMVENNEINLEELENKNSLFKDYGAYTPYVELLEDFENGEDLIYSDKLTLEEKYILLNDF